MTKLKLGTPVFAGMDEEARTDASRAAFAENLLTRGGILAPMAACEVLPAVLPRAVTTLAVLHRREETGEGAAVLIAAAGHQLYRCIGRERWEILPLPVDWPADGYAGSVWSWLNYEKEGTSVLLMSNARDGMIMIRGDNMRVSRVETPEKFGTIIRHAERVFGGVIDSAPDKLVYSAPYDPADWTARPEDPGEGAGDVLQPTWDGDGFTALYNCGSGIACFKRGNVWRLHGTDPGEYVFQEQTGGGCAAPRAIAGEGDELFFPAKEGLCRYDGDRVRPFHQGALRSLWRRVTPGGLSAACAVMHQGRYLLSLPLDGSRENNCVVILDRADHSWMLRTDIAAGCWLPLGEELLFTSPGAPGRLMRWRDPEGSGCTAVAGRWVSPCLDLGCPECVKSGITLYLRVKCSEEVTLLLRLRTEKRVREKRVTFSPAPDGQQPAERRIAFGGSGRVFSFEIESAAGAPWQITGGVRITAEGEEDD